uniref:Uncharacterized protein n=1 Tax=Podarcis muralis TaxID=64176 RepID=A0A670IE08_PODMU
MGYLQLLMVENFKSWQGKQCIGPFKKFTCVICPNGSGNISLQHQSPQQTWKSAHSA